MFYYPQPHHPNAMVEEAYNYSDVEDELDEDEDMYQHHPSEETILDVMVQSYDWAAVLGRIKSHPDECRTVGIQGRTPLHVACDHDAPAVVIQALLKAYPEASVLTGTSNMNPLHITCSSHHASVHIVRMLMEGGRFEQFSMRDVDGDTPLHAACRCGASREVIELLLRAHPSAVNVRDYEGLNPLLRLWVRYFVILGEAAIESVRSASDLQGELLDAWNKTESLLKCAQHGSLGSPMMHNVSYLPRQPQLESHSLLALHAASAVDCPRSIVKIAACVYPQQLHARDEQGRTPLMIACQAPVFSVRDLSDEGYSLEDVIHGDAGDAIVSQESHDDLDIAAVSSALQPSVIDILLSAGGNGLTVKNGASMMDPSARLPLHIALEAGKSWHQGVGALVSAFPEGVGIIDQSCRLYPFQLAVIKNDMDCAYELLKRNPSLLEQQRLDASLGGGGKNSPATMCPMS